MKMNFLLEIFDEAVSVDRAGVEALIREQLAPEIIQNAIENSVVLEKGKKLQDMTSNMTKLPVLESLPMAYFVDGDTGQKQTTKQEWDKKEIYAEEIAAIVAIPEAVLDDSEYDLVGEIVPRLGEAIGRVIDQAVLFGEGKPTHWPKGIMEQAEDAGAVVTSTVNLYDDLLGEGGTISKVEESGYFVNGHIAAIGMRAKLRSLKDNTGRPLFVTNMQDSGRYMLDGSDMMFVRNGGIDPKKALVISGDFTKLVYAIRKDIDVKIFDTGVIQNPDGSIKYNLLQQDMVAIRITMRLGWQLPNPVNAIAEKATRFPFAVLAPTGYNAYSVNYTPELLNKMSVDAIKSVAADRGYTLNADKKADIIEEFMAEQAVTKG